eukprot:5405554-Amphidinium_carterae.1
MFEAQFPHTHTHTQHHSAHQCVVVWSDASQDAMNRASKSTLYKLTLRNNSRQPARLQVDAQVMASNHADGVPELSISQST